MSGWYPGVEIELKNWQKLNSDIKYNWKQYLLSAILFRFLEIYGLRGLISDFQSQIEEYCFRDMFFVIDIFENFLEHFIF